MVTLVAYFVVFLIQFWKSSGSLTTHFTYRGTAFTAVAFFEKTQLGMAKLAEILFTTPEVFLNYIYIEEFRKSIFIKSTLAISLTNENLFTIHFIKYGFIPPILGAITSTVVTSLGCLTIIIFRIWVPKRPCHPVDFTVTLDAWQFLWDFAVVELFIMLRVVVFWYLTSSQKGSLWVIDGKWFICATIHIKIFYLRIY